MNEIIEFSTQHKTVFVRGFNKGLAAPLMLFGAHEGVCIESPKFIPLPKHNAAQNMTGDWVKIGADFKRVFAREQAKKQ